MITQIETQPLSMRDRFKALVEGYTLVNDNGVKVTLTDTGLCYSSSAAISLGNWYLSKSQYILGDYKLDMPISPHLLPNRGEQVYITNLRFLRREDIKAISFFPGINFT